MPSSPIHIVTFLVISLSWSLPNLTAENRTHRIILDDYFSLSILSSVASAPNGRHVAYVEERWDEEADSRNTDIWIADTKTGKTKRLTFDQAGGGHPQWSPDSQQIYFTSDRRRSSQTDSNKDSNQVWRIAIDGSGLMPVTRAKDGVGIYQVSGDGQSLYYTTASEVVDDPWKTLHEKYDTLQYGHGVTKLSQLWKLDLTRWRTKKIVDDKRVIDDFAVTSDGHRIAMLTTPTPELITKEGRSRIDIFNADSGEIESLPDELWRGKTAPSPYGWLESIAWTDDGSALAFGISFDGYPSELFVAEIGANVKPLKASIQKLARKAEITLMPGAGLHWKPSSRDLYVIGQSRARARVYAIENVRDGKQADTWMVTPGDVAAMTFDPIGKDGVAVVMSQVDHPGDLYVAKKTSGLNRITMINPQVDSWKLPSTKIVRWTSSDGTEVEGILELPPDHEPGKPLPMIVEIHGGPTAASLLPMRFWIYGRTLMPSRGYALLSPNYRGSTGYGEKFMTDLIGHKNNRDVADILAGVDAMIDRGIADPDRLGVMGWSNGGYLTNCLITTTTRFKAASSGAGILDAAMQWETEDTPGHVINFQQGLPWEVPEAMRKASPLFKLDQAKTPTIIHVGENDARCPPGHSRGLYRALHEYLNVPAELVVYPGEGHGLSTYQHRKAKMEWDQAWFKKYLPIDKPAGQ